MLVINLDYGYRCLKYQSFRLLGNLQLFAFPASKIKNTCHVF